MQSVQAVRRQCGMENGPLARVGMLSRCSSTIAAIAWHNMSLSANVLISGTAAIAVNADEYKE